MPQPDVELLQTDAAKLAPAAGPTIAQRLIATSNRPTGFDYMRLVLAASVIASHTVNVTLGEQTMLDLLQHPFIRATFGLILPMFFCLSGFLVAGSLERCKSIIGFLGLRVIRIIPALAVEVFLSALVLGPLLTHVPLRDYFASTEFRHYFLNIVGNIHYVLPGVFPSNPFPNTVNAQLWTVPIELDCYCGLSVLALAGMVWRRQAFLGIVIALQLLVVAAAIVVPARIAFNWDAPLLLLSFLAGIGAYLFRDKIPWNRRLCVVSGLVTFALPWVPHGEMALAGPAAYMTVYLGLCNPRKPAILAKGDYSYGMYLYGFPIQQSIASIGPAVQFWAINLVLSLPLAVGVAMLSWHFVERRALGLRKPLARLETYLLAICPFSRFLETSAGAHAATRSPAAVAPAAALAPGALDSKVRP